jgi:hypothetical protein
MISAASLWDRKRSTDVTSKRITPTGCTDTGQWRCHNCSCGRRSYENWDCHNRGCWKYFLKISWIHSSSRRTRICLQTYNFANCYDIHALRMSCVHNTAWTWGVSGFVQRSQESHLVTTGPRAFGIYSVALLDSLTAQWRRIHLTPVQLEVFEGAPVAVT